MHFGIPLSIISDHDYRFFATFEGLWGLMDTKLKRSSILKQMDKLGSKSHHSAIITHL
jgi:hypothetical protein